MSTEHGGSVVDRLTAVRESFDVLVPPVTLHELRQGAEPEGASPGSADGTGGALARRRLVVGGVAAALIAAGATGVWLVDAETSLPESSIVPSGQAPAPPTSPAAPATDTVGPPSSTQPSQTSSQAPDQASSGSESGGLADGSIGDLVAGLEPFAAAEMIWIDARYGPSPEQAADLAIANELASRACFEANGIELDAFDATRHVEWAVAERQSWDHRRSWLTPEGQQRLRAEGYYTRRNRSTFDLDLYPHARSMVIPEACYPAATGVTFLGTTSVWSQGQLDEALLEHERLAPHHRRFGSLSGTEDAHAAHTRCMIERGWEWDDQSVYADLGYEPTPTPTEIEIANDDIDCRIETDAVAIYLDALTAQLAEFQQEFGDELRAIERERADALAAAHTILIENGLVPLSD